MRPIPFEEMQLFIQWIIESVATYRTPSTKEGYTYKVCASEDEFDWSIEFDSLEDLYNYYCAEIE